MIVSGFRGIFDSERVDIDNELDILPIVISDCESAFNCRSIASNSENYSEGSTYFIKASEIASSNLENIAQQIFLFYSSKLEYDPLISGAEWWTQVIDTRDDIGFHWDRDYGSEEDDGVHIYPYLGTVTYLSSVGGPTIVMNKPGTTTSGTDIAGTVDRFSVSKPVVGKSIAFEGNLLHAAPAGLVEEESDDEDDSEESNEDDDSEVVTKRVTLLVNVWINHIPTQTVKFPEEERKSMHPLIPLNTLRLSFQQPCGAPDTVELLNNGSVESSCALTRTKQWNFNHAGINYDVLTPLPSVIETKAIVERNDVVIFEYATTGSDNDNTRIRIVVSEEQPDSSSLEEEDEGEEEDEEEDDDDDEDKDEEEDDDDDDSIGEDAEAKEGTAAKNNSQSTIPLDLQAKKKQKT